MGRTRQALRAWLERHPSDVEVLLADTRPSEPPGWGEWGDRPGQGRRPGSVLARLTGRAMVVLVLLLGVLPPGDWRGQLAAVGPDVLQNLTAGLLVGVYIFSLRRGRPDRSATHEDGRQDALLFAIGLAVYALADGLAVASSGSPLMLPLAGGTLGGLVLAQASRGLALGSAFVGPGVGSVWLVPAALLSGSLGPFGAAVGRQLSFTAASMLAVPALACAAAGLVLLLGRRLAPARERLPAGDFLVGFALGLASLRVLGANLV